MLYFNATKYTVMLERQKVKLGFLLRLHYSSNHKDASACCDTYPYKTILMFHQYNIPLKIQIGILSA